jgi:integrase
VTPGGSRYWRYKYRFHGKEKLLALGVYPAVSLLEAREKRLAAYKLLQDGIDPAAQKQDDKRQAAFKAENSFESVAEEWYRTNRNKWTDEHAERLWRRLMLHALPYIGKKPIGDIKALELLEVIRRIEKHDKTETSHRLLQTCNAIFRYAVLIGRIEYNPANDLKGVLKPHKTENYPALKPRELPEFLSKLAVTETTALNKLAIRMLLLTFVRQGELRQSKWEDFDFAAKEWHIPAEIMKMRERHIVPLARQTLALLAELKPISGQGEYLFPSQQRRRHPIMSENTINKVLCKMGYQGRLVGHGFRSIASTILNEQGFRPDLIEKQLAHAERNKVRAAYNRAEYLAERHKMMQDWADYLCKTVNPRILI